MSDIKETSDIDLTAYLIVTGFKLIGPPKRKERLVIFQFKNSPELERAWNSYFDKRTSVDALTFSETTRKLRTQIKEFGLGR
jgi:hypothetical protein